MNRLLFIACAALVGAAVIAGLTVVGGPGHARMEKRDNQRAQDLLALGEYYRCTLPAGADAQTGVAPSPKHCSGKDQAPTAKDPLTGKPYEMTRSNERGFEVCARFELEDEDRNTVPYFKQQIKRTGKRGCVVYERHAATGIWERI